MEKSINSVVKDRNGQKNLLFSTTELKNMIHIQNPVSVHVNLHVVRLKNQDMRLTHGLRE